MYCAQGASGKQYPKSTEAEVRSIEGFRNGRAWMGVWSKHRWPESLWERTPQTVEKMGTKRSVLTDEKGLPLAVIRSGANTHDVKLLAETLDSVVVFRPRPSGKRPQNLCLDAGYTGRQDEVEARGYIVHIRPRGEEKKNWNEIPISMFATGGVEVTHSFFNRFRKLLVRFEKKADNYLALIQFACAIIVWRNLIGVHS